MLMRPFRCYLRLDGNGHFAGVFIMEGEKVPFALLHPSPRTQPASTEEARAALEALLRKLHIPTTVTVE